MFRKLKMLSSVFAFLLCLTGVAYGQETSGEIQGTVKDPQGAVVPGVTVTIRGVDIGFNRTITTDQEGFYRARQIPPGTYNVEAAAASGFAGQTKERILVTLGQATTVDFELAVTGAVASIDVTADTGLTVDATDTKIQENITAREIEGLPKGTNITSLLRTTAAVRPEPLSGQFQINGGSGSENTFIIDGQEVTNFRTGVLNSNNDIPFQSVQEVQVKSSGFEAEFGGATGGVINIVTKGGTNEWHGEMGLQFEARKFWAGPRPVLVNQLHGLGATGQTATYLPQNRDGGTNFFPSVQIGGPIVKDRFWGFAEWSPRFFNTRRTTTFIPNLFTGALANTPGQAAIQTATAGQINEYARLRLDASPSNTLRLSTSFTWNPIIQNGLLLGGTTAVSTPSCAQFQGLTCVVGGAELAALQGGRQNSNNFRSEGVWTPNSKFVFLGRYTRGFLNERLGAYGVTDVERYRIRACTGPFAAPSGQPCPGVGAPLNFTNTNNNFVINKDVSVRNQVNLDASYLASGFGGRHEFKGGYEYNTIFNDVDRGHPKGRIDLYFGNRTSYPLCLGAFPTPPFAPQAGNIGIGCSYRFATKGSAENKNQALYIQDKWQPTNRLTLNLGVRIENEALPAFNGQTTNLKFGWTDKIAPRLGFAYDLTGDGKTKVAASYGQFYDRLKFELPRGSFGGDFYRVDYFDIMPGTNTNFTSFNAARIIGNFGDPIGGGCPITGITGITRCQFDFRVPSNLPNLVLSNGAPLQPGAVDPDLKPFRQSEFNVQVEREVWENSRVRGSFIHRNVDSAVEDAGFLTSTGSEFYIIANPGEGLHAQRAHELGFERLVKPQRRYDAGIVEFDTRFVKNLNLNLNYTYSRLFGNYSGLASSDENGRTSPGVNRFFDQPFLGFTAAGKPDNGRLATDRPHVFKASGVYTHDWKGANSTDFSFFTTATSGTPLTTFVTVTDAFIPIPKTVRGDLGRTEMFTQTDLGLTHRYRFGSNERWALAFDVNVLNLFNENNVLGIDNSESSGFYGLSSCEITPTCNANSYRDSVNILTSRGVLNELAASVAHDPDFNINQSYKLANSFQNPRQVRFGFRFMF